MYRSKDNLRYRPIWGLCVALDRGSYDMAHAIVRPTDFSLANSPLPLGSQHEKIVHRLQKKVNVRSALKSLSEWDGFCCDVEPRESDDKRSVSEVADDLDSRVVFRFLKASLDYNQRGQSRHHNAG